MPCMRLEVSDTDRRDPVQAPGEMPGSAILAAVDSERRRIERDLHDGSQQLLTSAMMTIHQARAHLIAGEEQEAAPLLELAMDRLLDTAAELRRVTRSIYPAQLQTIGLVNALRGLLERSPLAVDFQAGELPRLPEPVELAVYFVATEALANVLKHARTSHVAIRLDLCGERQLELIIADDGVGTVDESQGTGLRGLRERVRATGGVLEIRSNPGYGTSLHASFPVATPYLSRRERRRSFSSLPSVWQVGQ